MTSQRTLPTLSVRLAGLAAVGVVSVLLVAGCSTTKTLDQDKLHDFIEDELISDAGAEVTNADCPEITDPEDGDTFECTADVNGQSARIGVTVTNADDGTVSVAPLDSILNVEKLETNLALQVGEENGVEVTVECSEELFLVQAVDSVFGCQAADGQGNTLDIDVTVNDAEGNVSYAAAN